MTLSDVSEMASIMVTYPYAYMTYIVSPLAGLGGAYHGGRPPTACLLEHERNFFCECPSRGTCKIIDAGFPIHFLG